MFSFVAGMLSSSSPTGLTLELLSHGTYAGYNGGTGQDFWNLNRNIQQEQQPEILACIRQKKKKKHLLLEKVKKECDRKQTKNKIEQMWKDLMMSRWSL